MTDLEICDYDETTNNRQNCTEDYGVYDGYTQTCVPLQLIQFEDVENDVKLQIIYGIILPVLAVLVVVSNSVVILVLSQQKSKRASVEPLLWMAICSLLMAISPLPFTIYYYNLSHHLDFNQTLFLCYLQKVCMEIMPFFFNNLVLLFTILLGVQRFIVVQYPLQSIRWCTPKMVRRYSKLILILATFLTGFHSLYDIRLLYHFCIKYRDESFWVARCFIGYSSLTSAFGADAFSALFDYFRITINLLASGLLFVVTILLIQTIRTHDHPKQGVHRHKNRKTSANTTIMLTVIIIIYMLARVPTTLLFLLVKLMDYISVPTIAFEVMNNIYLRVFANITTISLHPISFAIYMFMSRKFRVSMRRLLGWRFLASDEEFNAFTSSTRIHTAHPKMTLMEKESIGSSGKGTPSVGQKRGMSVDFKISFDVEPQRRRRATTADTNHVNFRRFAEKSEKTTEILKIRRENS
ncbi:G-protein coupled receptors family 1 profile domain-containing protein [Caenorhabditis elegans]|uniref:G-protein coupled receptors family 1 profile domain-containing protein n=1 Tax=Caenorhabditis elegans TaxID=6239 RepID=Q95XI5_CAEEL|nr:G-protein coupled receptors family 1 profile domain-containing protein [Caenorhabditis elegans]CCD74119.1 G-protein coupled receptors family 1 profile domain-containing protein [Caenorhabditis elegans]|eukprot:NP_500218.2 Sex Peptide Receptor (Drosophila) Related [Caenorhabditis elegans]